MLQPHVINRVIAFAVLKRVTVLEDDGCLELHLVMVHEVPSGFIDPGEGLRFYVRPPQLELYKRTPHGPAMGAFGSAVQWETEMRSSDLVQGLLAALGSRHEQRSWTAALLRLAQDEGPDTAGSEALKELTELFQERLNQPLWVEASQKGHGLMVRGLTPEEAADILRGGCR